MIDQYKLSVQAANTGKKEDYEKVGYVMGFYEPHYPVPAIRIAFDIWPPESTVSGKYELTGMEEYKRGHWRCFVTTDEPWRD